MATSGPDPVPGSSIAELVINTMGNQSEVASGLSVAICGGVVAFIIQIAIYNRSEGNDDIRLKGGGWLVAGFVIEAASIMAGIVLKGVLVSAIPSLYSASYKANEQLSNNDITALQPLQCFSLTQLSLFILGVLVFLPFFYRNRKLLR